MTSLTSCYSNYQSMVRLAERNWDEANDAKAPLSHLN